MKNKGPITIQDLNVLENELERIKELFLDQHREIKDHLDRLKRKSEYKLIDVGTAAELLDVTERQVHHLAKNSESSGIHKYNPDGSKKTGSRPTTTRFNKLEILDYRDRKNKGKHSK